MKRMLTVIALFAAVCVARSAVAQGPGGFGFKKKGFPGAGEADGIRKLTAELEKLRVQLDEVERLLKKAQGTPAKETPSFGKWDGWKGFDKKGFAEWKGWGPPWAGADWKKGFGPKDFGQKKFERPAVGRPASSDIDERLDRLTRDLEELRRALKKR
jgi:hypothetical protein